jgi:hypothetical protein
MLYNNFVVVTDTPARLRDFLINRGVIEQDAEGNLVGVRPGMEWVKVPNPIVTDPGSGVPGEPGYIPPTYDTRSVFLVKFAHESLDDDMIEGSPGSGDVLDWSKFGNWVKNNSTVQAAPAGWTINGEPAGNARKVNGEQVWLVHDRPERFGVWQ